MENVFEENIIGLSENKVFDIFVNNIEIQQQKERDADIWANSVFAGLPTLESNNSGNVGEYSLNDICNALGIPSTVDGSKTKEAGGGKGDGTINGVNVEIKTARLGINNAFQHELGEKPWLAEYMAFIDITPNDVYLTIFKNHTEAEYLCETRKYQPFPTRNIFRRKGDGNFKLDTTIAINKKNVLRGNTFHITSTTVIDSKLRNYINSKIV